MPTPPEYAPQYSRAERLRVIMKFGLPVLLLMLLLEFVFFPWYRGFAEQADCKTLFGLSGRAVVLYIPFLLLPLLFSIVAAAYFIPLARRIWADGQYPPSGMKTMDRRRIRRGWQAKWIALFFLAIVVLMAGFTVKSGLSARSLLQEMQAKHPAKTVCQGQPEHQAR